MNDIANALEKAGITAETAQETAPPTEVTLTDTAPEYAAPHGSEGGQRGRAQGQKFLIRNTIALFMAKLKPIRETLKIGLHETRPLPLEEVQAKMREIVEKSPEKLMDPAFLATVRFEKTGGDFTLPELLAKFGPDKVITIKTADITAHYEAQRAEALALLSTLDCEKIGIITAEAIAKARAKAKAEKETSAE